MKPRKLNPRSKKLCEHPQTVSYEPTLPIDPMVEIEIDESSSDVKTCTSVAKYVLGGVHYCDRHYSQVTTQQSGEYSEYGDPDPIDPSFSMGD
jgi:hypothetical protein